MCSPPARHTCSLHQALFRWRISKLAVLPRRENAFPKKSTHLAMDREEDQNRPICKNAQAMVISPLGEARPCGRLYGKVWKCID